MKKTFLNGIRRWCSILVFAAAGCGAPENAVDRLSFSAAGESRQRAFVRAVTSALQSFEKLNVPTVVIKTEEMTNGNPVVTICDSSIQNPAYCEKAISLGVANLCLAYPGIRFRSDGDRRWMVLIPGEVVIPASGSFDFGILGKH